MVAYPALPLPGRLRELRPWQLGTGLAALVLLLLLSGFGRPPPPPPGGGPHGGGGLPWAHSCTWTPYSLPLEAQQFATAATRLGVPSAVRSYRQLLTVQLALGVLQRGVPGDFVETGVLRGGTTILMLKTLERYDALSAGRRHWAADSFQGLPDPVDQDKNGSLVTGVKGAFLSSREEFDKNVATANIARVGERLRVLTGWFNETLPGAPIKAISYLRLDGDLYVSTRDALEALYDRVSPGGAIYVDDYGSYTGCRRAIDEFRAQRGITAPLRLQSLPEGGLAPTSKLLEAYEAVWWIKPPCPPETF